MGDNSSDITTIQAEDRVTITNINDLLDQAQEESNDAKRARINREVIEEHARGIKADPDRMLCVIEQRLIDFRIEYPSLLDIHNDRIEDVALKVRDHMIDAERNKEPLTHLQALGRLEGLAAQARFRIREDISAAHRLRGIVK